MEACDTGKDGGDVRKLDLNAAVLAHQRNKPLGFRRVAGMHVERRRSAEFRRRITLHLPWVKTLGFPNDLDVSIPMDDIRIHICAC